MIVSVKGAYYQYCDLPAATFDGLMAAPSMGQFFKRIFGCGSFGLYDCRTGRGADNSRVPEGFYRWLRFWKKLLLLFLDSVRAASASACRIALRFSLNCWYSVQSVAFACIVFTDLRPEAISPGAFSTENSGEFRFRIVLIRARV